MLGAPSLLMKLEPHDLPWSGAGHATFSFGGVIAGVRPSTPLDDLHPSLVLVLTVGGDRTRILVPPEVWPASPEFLEVGRYVAVSGWTDSFPFLHGSVQVATAVYLPGTYH